MSKRTVVFPAIAVAILGVVVIKLTMFQQPTAVKADEPPEVIRLTGVLRDFHATHPDFDITNTAVMGHCVWNVDHQLSTTRRPEHAGNGVKVTEQWYDKDGNPIMPYLGGDDPGLPGGHFDVDVFDEATDKELYHKHQFDDAYDVTYVDLVHDPKLLFEEVIGFDYPNNLRMTFLNQHHGSGTYLFEANGSRHTGTTQSGFEIIFDPATLTQCRIDFRWLMELRGTQPGVVQGDVVNRDDSLAVRMYDVTTNALVYELAVYHHTKGDDDPGLPPTIEGKDACNEPIRDTTGDFSNDCGGAITDAGTFGQWYRDDPGTNMSKAHTISLYRNGDGIYEFLTDDFYPADGQLLGDDGDSHNNFFTYGIFATFTYEACTGQFFEFEGNDDCWVFINGKKVLDLGGANTPTRQYIALDRLDLEDGQEYPLDFFFAHRRDSMDSVFRMRTNIVLSTGLIGPVSGGYD